MPATKIGSRDEDVISASWQRCERQHGLVRETAYPILRLQSSEVAPRSQEMVERIGGHRGVFRQLAEIAAKAGHCLALSDTDCVLVRVEGKDNDRPVFERYGIALGSCWNEKVAGTNGVAIAMAQSDAFTVCGPDHYFSKLRPFACTAAPLFDAENRMIGAINLAGIDRGNAAEYVFAQKLLDEAAAKIQRMMFEQRFRDAMIISISGLEEYAPMPSNQLVAIDEAGIILGATAKAHQLARKPATAELLGESCETVFGIDTSTIDRVPERILSTPPETGHALSMSLRQPDLAVYPGRGWQPPSAKKKAKPTRRRLSPTLRLLALGSEAMSAILGQARAHFERALPFIIEGESGTGKTTLIDALHGAAHLKRSQMVMVDCALLDHQAVDRGHAGGIFEHARVIDARDDDDHGNTTLVFENIDEMPRRDQARLRNLLTALEAYDDRLDETLASSALRIVATCRKPLKDAVEQGRFRDDLYFLISNARFKLPPLRMRERPEDLARALASQLAGSDVEITEEAIGAISHHEWPGNVRELRGALRQALMAGDGRRISLLDLQASSAFSGSEYHLSMGGAKPLAASNRLYDEKTMLLDALCGAGWNISRAARTLGIGRATIHRKMKRHGITRPGLSERPPNRVPA